MTRMDPPPRFGRPAAAELGMGSVGEGGSVGTAKARRVSAAYSRRTGLSAVLKIRVSWLDSVPGHHFQLDDWHEFSGITRGRSGAIDG